MSWRHRIALALLLALTGLPVGGTLCAIMCESSTQASHHGTAQTCEEPARSSSGPQITGQSEHDCSTHTASLRQVATTAAERADVKVKTAPGIIVSPDLGTLVVLNDPEHFSDYTVPLGTAPPTARPDVLRV